MLIGTGCTALFGWDIHAPGLLSNGFFYSVKPLERTRVALYVDPAAARYVSHDKGGRTADPQTYDVGEAFLPMLIEAFQAGFEEFIFLEVEPEPAVLRRYAIPYLAVVRIKDFQNDVSWKGQALSLGTETVVMDTEMKVLGKFESKGSSDSEKIFSKKGGPQVNLNAAIENNVTATVQYVQDSIRTGNW